MKILMATADHLMIDRRILQEARSLISRGYEVTLLAGFECPKRESYSIDGIRIERFMYDWGDSRFMKLAQRFGLRPGTSLYGLGWKAFRLWVHGIASLNSYEQFVLDRMMEYPVDIIHVHDYPMLAPAVELARIRKVPLIYDAHEIYYSQIQLPKHIQRRYRRKEAALIPSCNAVITVNPYLARIMGERYSIREPYVIMNAAPLLPMGDMHPLRDRFGLERDARIVLYQGWISDNRGIERIVEAASLFKPGIYLVIVGYGDFEAHLKDIVADKGLGKRVLFYGGVPSEKLHELTN